MKESDSSVKSCDAVVNVDSKFSAFKRDQKDEIDRENGRSSL